MQLATASTLQHSKPAKLGKSGGFQIVTIFVIYRHLMDGYLACLHETCSVLKC